MEGFAEFLFKLGTGTLELVTEPIVVGVFVFSVLLGVVIMVISLAVRGMLKKRGVI